MDNVLSRIKSFYKAQTIQDPMAIATYVTTRYGIPDERKYSIARGIAGKSRATQWNTATKGTGQSHKTGKHGSTKKYKGDDYRPKGEKSGSGRKYKGVKQGERVAGRKTKRAVAKRTSPKKPAGVQRRLPGMKAIEKAESIKDTRKLAHHLASGGARGSHGQANPKMGWMTWEGGMRGKANAKKWNPIQDPDARGFSYTSSGLRIRPEAKKAAAEARKKAGRAKAAATRAKKKAEPKQLKLPMKAMNITKTFDVLLKAHKFGGKPLGWEELPRDPISFATNVMQDKGFKNTNLSANTDGANTRNKLAQGIRALINEIPDATKKEIKAGKRTDEKWAKEAKKRKKEMEASWAKGDREAAINLKKQAIPPALAGLAAFGAGWAMSDTFTEAPRGQMTPSQQRNWERLIRSTMRRKKTLRKDGIDALQSYYKDSSDTYVRRTPIENSLVISKEHAPVPPRQGLVFDAMKHRWTSQEKVGRTVAEVQGKKRIRGTGTGQHEHSKSGGGAKGLGMSAEAGRRYRSPADAGVIKPHEGKHPATAHQKITKKKLLQHLRGRAGTVRTVH